MAQRIILIESDVTRHARLDVVASYRWLRRMGNSPLEAATWLKGDHAATLADGVLDGGTRRVQDVAAYQAARTLYGQALKFASRA